MLFECAALLLKVFDWPLILQFASHSLSKQSGDIFSN